LSDGQVENDTEGDTTGVGPFVNTPPFRTPPRIKDRKARGVRNRMRVVDLDTLILTAREMRAQFRTPPPPLKDRMARGLRNRIPTVDLGAQILTV
jgi:hypothetical protein